MFGLTTSFESAVIAVAIYLTLYLMLHRLPLGEDTTLMSMITDTVGENMYYVWPLVLFALVWGSVELAEWV